MIDAAIAQVSSQLNQALKRQFMVAEDLSDGGVNHLGALSRAVDSSAP